MANKRYPLRDHVYTLDVILRKLSLDDRPSLGFQLEVEGKTTRQVVQTAHVTREELLSIPGFGASQWRYKYTTQEWIPVFSYEGADVVPISNFVDIEPDISPFPGTVHTQWVTPKGFPREQLDWSYL